MESKHLAPPRGLGDSSPPQYHLLRSSLLIQAHCFCVGSLGILSIFEIGQSHCKKKKNCSWKAQLRKQKERLKTTVHSGPRLNCSFALSARHHLLLNHSVAKFSESHLFFAVSFSDIAQIVSGCGSVPLCLHPPATILPAFSLTYEQTRTCYYPT